MNAEDIVAAAEKALRGMEMDQARGHYCWYCSHEEWQTSEHTPTCVIHDLRNAIRAARGEAEVEA